VCRGEVGGGGLEKGLAIKKKKEGVRNPPPPRNKAHHEVNLSLEFIKTFKHK